MTAPASRGRGTRRTSSIRRVLVGYLIIVALLCGGFTVATVTIVRAADHDRATALIDGDLAETLEKLAGPPALRRDKALAIVLARTALGGDRLYRLRDGNTVIAGESARVMFKPARSGLLMSDAPPALAREVPIAPGVTLLVGRRLVQGELTHRLLLVGLAILLGVLAIATTVGLVTGAALTARIDAINAACDRVRLGDFAARVPHPAGGDEFATLGRHVNAMLERIDMLVSGLRDTSNRIAHDLRTPVARLRDDLAEAARATDLPRARALAGAAVAETDEILQTFEALLDIAEVEGGAGGLAPMRLDEAARSACELYEGVAEAADVKVAADLVPSTILGERMLIVRAVANLVDNAIKFSAAGGTVRIGVAPAGCGFRLLVSDEGPGIRADERERVMRRFERGHAGVGVAGHGLGLALVSAVARRHGATVTLRDGEPGLRVELLFDRFADDAAPAGDLTAPAPPART